MKRIHALVLAAALAMPASGAMAQGTQSFSTGILPPPPPSPNERQVVVVPRGPGLVEAAISSCAGGASIGYLLVYASGVGDPLATSALFCGLSAAASVTGGLTSWVWRSVTGQ